MLSPGLGALLLLHPSHALPKKGMQMGMLNQNSNLCEEQKSPWTEMSVTWKGVRGRKDSSDCEMFHPELALTVWNETEIAELFLCTSKGLHGRDDPGLAHVSMLNS